MANQTNTNNNNTDSNNTNNINNNGETTMTNQQQSTETMNTTTRPSNDIKLANNKTLNNSAKAEGEISMDNVNRDYNSYLEKLEVPAFGVEDIVRFEIDIPVYNNENTISRYQARMRKQKASKAGIYKCGIHNGDLMANSNYAMAVVNPIRTNGSPSTKVYEVKGNGERTLIDAKDFFGVITDKTLVKLFINFDLEELDAIVDSEETSAIRLTIPATQEHLDNSFAKQTPKDKSKETYNNLTRQEFKFVGHVGLLEDGEISKWVHPKSKFLPTSANIKAYKAKLAAEASKISEPILAETDKVIAKATAADIVVEKELPKEVTKKEWTAGEGFASKPNPAPVVKSSKADAKEETPAPISYEVTRGELTREELLEAAKTNNAPSDEVEAEWGGKNNKNPW